MTDGLTYLFWTLQYLFLIPKTYWLNGVWVSPLTCLKILLNLSLTPWPAHFWPCPSHHCGHDCLGYNALEVYLGHFSQPNPLLLRHWVGAWVALVATIIADAHFGSGSVLVNVHGYGGVQSLGGFWGLHLWDLCLAQKDGLFQFGKASVGVVQVMDNILPVIQTRW